MKKDTEIQSYVVTEFTKETVGSITEYHTKDMRLLLRVYMDNPDDPKTKYFTSLTGYNISNAEFNSDDMKIMGAGPYDTYHEALQVGTKFVEDNFLLTKVK